MQLSVQFFFKIEPLAIEIDIISKISFYPVLFQKKNKINKSLRINL